MAVVVAVVSGQRWWSVRIAGELDRHERAILYGCKGDTHSSFVTIGEYDGYQTPFGRGLVSIY